MSECLSTDEQMCATKHKHHLKVYVPDNALKWGYTFFVFANDYGFAHLFKICSATDATLRENEKNLDASSDVVVRLARNIPSANITNSSSTVIILLSRSCFIWIKREFSVSAPCVGITS